MRRALMWLNLYGREAVWHELKNGLNTQKSLLTQGQIHEIFEKNYWELAELKNSVFLSRPFWIFFSKKKKKFTSSPWKLVKVSWVSRMGRNFDDYPGFQQKITPPKHFSRQCMYVLPLRNYKWMNKLPPLHTPIFLVLYSATNIWAFCKCICIMQS